MLGPFLVGITELELAVVHLVADESAPLYERGSSDVVPLEDFIPQMSWRGAQRKLITTLGNATLSLLKPRKSVDENGFKFVWGSEGS